MEFLPLEKNGERIYAGFWKRFAASIVDLVIIIPLIALSFVENWSIVAAMISMVFSSLLYSVYTIYFHYKFGATLGKMAVGIIITMPNGEKIGIREALLRSAVDFVFAFLIMVAQVIALSKADPAVIQSAGWLERAIHTEPLLPVWFVFVSVVSQIWYWSEFVVLLLNKRKRALHDFIAGTVVIQKKFAQHNF